MNKTLIQDAHVDERGVIQDVLAGTVDGITRISTKEGAVRGNHVHNRTVQWTYVISGALLMANGKAETVLAAGEIMHHPAGEPHAWKALEDTDCMVFTRGPRYGRGFESDTFRLERPLL